MTTGILAGLVLLVGCSNPTGGGERFVEKFGSGEKQVEGYLLADRFFVRDRWGQLIVKLDGTGCGFTNCAIPWWDGRTTESVDYPS